MSLHQRESARVATQHSGQAEHAPPQPGAPGAPNDPEDAGFAGAARAPSDAARAGVEAYYRRILPFYDAELANRGDERFWQRIASAYAGKRVLELGCGTGRVTALLAEHAGEVVAIDLSPDLLARARQRLRASPRVRLVQADMRSLAFRRPFDLIVAANDPFSHLIATADRAQTLATVRAHLGRDGRFILDALWFPPDDAAEVSRPGGRTRCRAVAVGGETLLVIEHWTREPGRPSCRARYEYRRFGRPPVVAEFDARDWTPAELMPRLAQAGLSATAVWGDFDASPWDRATSQHLVVVAAPAGSPNARPGCPWHAACPSSA